MTKVNVTTAAVLAVISCLNLLGVISLSGDQIAAIGAACSAVFLAVAAWFNPKVPFGPTE